MINIAQEKIGVFLKKRHNVYQEKIGVHFNN